VSTPGTRRRLIRLPAEGRFGGVCAGIADYLGTDVTLVRLAWVILSIVPGALIGGVLAYVAAWLVIPEGTYVRPSLPSSRRLTRSSTDRRIAGVCGGIAEYFNLDSTVVRVLAVILTIYPGVVICGVLAYLIAWFIIPASPEPALEPSTSSP
jgi:phage shock protein C